MDLSPEMAKKAEKSDNIMIISIRERTLEKERDMQNENIRNLKKI